ncbi:IPExxxVDY family protein [Olleya sp. HaHaR_3_96]|uniref:IPExxxVDY family protein n=1 Tax=Olleya sp. HaHaR_3_96 TaxID=2745560 RepID=UPI001C4F2E34|nr:IPExxxVDY family protein [Olleya sp. HaHaR_3_96]QXP60489.1 IPExxxVDY family protein [Olleya sp. HaHaR_3_96]
MAVRKLSLDDFLEEEHYALIGIHCVIEDYRLAFLINQTLDISLKRAKEDVTDPSLNTSYAIFEWFDEKQLTTYHLVANSCKVQYNNVQQQSNSLFGEDTSGVTNFYLLPEFKKVNYILKVETEFLNKEKIILNNILKIPQVSTAYSIDVEGLKSKENLIFN